MSETNKQLTGAEFNIYAIKLNYLLFKHLSNQVSSFRLPAVVALRHMAPIVIAEMITAYLVGDTTFDQELRDLQKELADRNEILAINVSHNMNPMRQQEMMLRIFKLERIIQEVTDWELAVDTVMATLNSMTQHWNLNFSL